MKITVLLYGEENKPFENEQPWAGCVAQWVEVLPIIHKALGLVPSTTQKQACLYVPIIPALGKWMQESQTLMDIFGYKLELASWVPAWQDKEHRSRR